MNFHVGELGSSATIVSSRHTAATKSTKTADNKYIEAEVPLSCIIGTAQQSAFDQDYTALDLNKSSRKEDWATRRFIEKQADVCSWRILSAKGWRPL